MCALSTYPSRVRIVETGVRSFFASLFAPHRRISTCSSGYKTTASHLHVIERYESQSRLAVSESWFAGCSVCYCDRCRDTNNVISECEIPTNFWHSSSERGRYQHNASIVIERQRTVGFKGTGALHQHEFEEGKTQQRRIVVDFIQLRRRS